MARLPRFLLADLPHHVVQRGHNGQPIAIDDVDRQRWRELLRDAAVTHQVALHAWALRDAAFHLVATPTHAEGLSRMMQSLARRHAAEFNRRHGRRGTLWEGRFRASLTEPGPDLLDLMLLVETLAAGPLGDQEPPPDPSASSLGHHLGQWRDPAITEPAAWWALGNTPFEREAAWRLRAGRGVALERAQRLQAALQRGRPVGSPVFLQRLSADGSLPPLSRPRGRPRKSALQPPLAEPPSAAGDAAPRH